MFRFSTARHHAVCDGATPLARARGIFIRSSANSSAVPGGFRTHILICERRMTTLTSQFHGCTIHTAVWALRRRHGLSFGAGTIIVTRLERVDHGGWPVDRCHRGPGRRRVGGALFTTLMILLAEPPSPGDRVMDSAPQVNLYDTQEATAWMRY